MRAVARGRRLGRAALRGPSERGRAARGSRGIDPRGALARRVGRRPGARARASRRARAATRCPRREGVLLGRGRARPGARDRARRGGAPRSSTSTSHGRRDRPRLVPRPAGCAPPRAIACVFHGAPVLARSASPASSTREPWFSARRDPHRGAPGRGSPTRPPTAALARPRAPSPSSTTCGRSPPGRIATAQATIDRWFEHAAPRPTTTSPATSRSQLRAAVADAGAQILDEAARATRLAPVRDRHARSTARAATSSCSCSSTGSTRWSRGSGARSRGGDEAAACERRALRRALRRRPRPVGVRDERVRARPSTTRRSRRSRAGASRTGSRSAARSACSPQRLAPHVDDLLAIDVAEAALERGARARPATSRFERREIPEEFPAGRVRPDRRLRGPLLPRRARLRRDARRDRRALHRARCSPSTGARRPQHLPAARRRGPRRGSPARFGPPRVLARRRARLPPRPASDACGSLIVGGGPAALAAARALPRGRRRRRRRRSSRRSRPSLPAARRCRRSSCAARSTTTSCRSSRRAWYAEHGVERPARRRRRRARSRRAHASRSRGGETLALRRLRARHRRRAARGCRSPGADRRGVLRAAHRSTDARALRDARRAAERAIVVGSGLHRLRGRRLAGDARRCEVTLVSRRGRPAARRGSARRPARRIAGLARGARRRARARRGVEAIGEHAGRRPRRRPLDADLVLMAAGVQPARRPRRPTRGSTTRRRPRSPSTRACAPARRDVLRGRRRRLAAQRRRRPALRSSTGARRSTRARSPGRTLAGERRAVGRRARLLVDDRRAHAQVRRLGRRLRRGAPRRRTATAPSRVWYGRDGRDRRRAHPRARRGLRARPRADRAGSAAAVTRAARRASSCPRATRRR